MNHSASKTSIKLTKNITKVYTMKKQILTIIASFLLLGSTSNAIEFGIGVSGSMALVSAEGTETETSNTGAEGSVRDASVDAMTGVGSIFAEVILDNGFVFGAEIVPMSADVSDATHSRADTSVAASGEGVTGTNTRTADAEVENFTTLYTEIPLGGMFIKAGLSQIDINTLENNLTNGGSYKNDTVDGVTYGLGVRGEWAGFYTKLAMERTNFDEYVSSSGTTNTITADLDVDQIKFSIGKAF